MFTGIIKNIGQILASEKRQGSLFLRVKKPKRWNIKKGDSMALDGICLTTKKTAKNWFLIELMPETLKRTTFGKLAPKKVNLERPLRQNDRLGGHIVLGHIDTAGKIIAVKKSGSSKIYTFSFPKKYRYFVAEKGSIAIDGVSLTIVKAEHNRFSVSLVSHTLSNTTLGEKRAGGIVNIEFDIIAKYIKHPQNSP